MSTGRLVGTGGVWGVQQHMQRHPAIIHVQLMAWKLLNEMISAKLRVEAFCEGLQQLTVL